MTNDEKLKARLELVTNFKKTWNSGKWTAVMPFLPFTTTASPGIYEILTVMLARWDTQPYKNTLTEKDMDYFLAVFDFRIATTNIGGDDIERADIFTLDDKFKLVPLIEQMRQKIKERATETGIHG